MSDLSKNSDEDQLALETAGIGNETIPLNDANQVALCGDENRHAVTIPSFSLNKGTFHGANFGPKTKNEVHASYEYVNPQITHHHHYYPENRQNSEGSTSDMKDGEDGQAAESSMPSKGCTKISEDVTMFNDAPLREGTKIFGGQQRHACGAVRDVAVKMVVPCNDKNVKEVQHLVKLASHPNVVQIIESKENQGNARELFIVMELCSSENMQDYLKKNREDNIPLDFKKTMSFSKELVDGMKHIHSNNIVHRDMKPQNVLLSLDHEHIKVSDFGISKELRHGKSVTKQTTYGQGTDGYRAPETYNSDKISKKSDIYSLGLTLFSLWSNGKHPFGEDDDLLNYNIKKDKNRSFSGLLLSGSERELFVDLMELMLEFNPEKRPTIEEVKKHPFFAIMETSSSNTDAMRDNSQDLETVLEDSKLHLFENKQQETCQQQLFQQLPVVREEDLEILTMQNPEKEQEMSTGSETEPVSKCMHQKHISNMPENVQGIEPASEKVTEHLVVQNDPENQKQDHQCLPHLDAAETDPGSTGEQSGNDFQPKPPALRETGNRDASESGKYQHTTDELCRDNATHETHVDLAGKSPEDVDVLIGQQPLLNNNQKTPGKSRSQLVGQLLEQKTTGKKSSKGKRDLQKTDTKDTLERGTPQQPAEKLQHDDSTHGKKTEGKQGKHEDLAGESAAGANVLGTQCPLLKGDQNPARGGNQQKVQLLEKKPIEKKGTGTTEKQSGSNSQPEMQNLQEIGHKDVPERGKRRQTSEELSLDNATCIEKGEGEQSKAQVGTKDPIQNVDAITGEEKGSLSVVMSQHRQNSSNASGARPKRGSAKDRRRRRKAAVAKKRALSESDVHWKTEQSKASYPDSHLEEEKGGEATKLHLPSRHSSASPLQQLATANLLPQAETEESMFAQPKDGLTSRRQSSQQADLPAANASPKSAAMTADSGKSRRKRSKKKQKPTGSCISQAPKQLTVNQRKALGCISELLGCPETQFREKLSRCRAMLPELFSCKVEVMCQGVYLLDTTLESLNEGHRIVHLNTAEEDSSPSKIRINSKERMVCEIEGVSALETTAVLTTLRPDIVLWFDEKVLELFAQTLCKTETSLYSDFENQDRRRCVLARNKFSVFSIKKYVELLKEFQGKGELPTMTKGIKLYIGDWKHSCLEIVLMPSVIDYFEKEV